ncbi:3-hydroxyacyl-ACP dehydratase [Mucilaginibacter auburnensis]|uniref:Putative hotdog family 3-hydroxylacyl-ACP dehydratase n=1 Tax=Mucilaginibacter auburnensis TaxID=1457233 RepID=A0A2H9VW02_9SPHI|nr:3-hydroxyacyl-ACP dehydratase [Mucilaginibacter auburnensis]PJJ84991.1 putative hotdog family 3-hydroxylacyl-ACP dehydratase [Mucilaginibacter auburnensis]
MEEFSILSLIPQKSPFVMVDELLFSDDNVTRTKFKVRADNVFAMNGEFSEAGLMENMAQTAAAGSGNMARIEDRPVATGYIGQVKNLEVFELPKIGDELLTEIKVEVQVFDAGIVSGKVWKGDALIAQCEMKIFINQQ